VIKNRKKTEKIGAKEIWHESPSKKYQERNSWLARTNWWKRGRHLYLPYFIRISALRLMHS